MTLWTVAHQSPLPMGFSRKQYRSGLPCPSAGDLSPLGIQLVSLTSLAIGRQVLDHQRHNQTSPQPPASYCSIYSSCFRLQLTKAVLPPFSASPYIACTSALHTGFCSLHGTEPALVVIGGLPLLKPVTELLCYFGGCWLFFYS